MGDKLNVLWSINMIMKFTAPGSGGHVLGWSQYSKNVFKMYLTWKIVFSISTAGAYKLNAWLWRHEAIFFNCEPHDPWVRAPNLLVWSTIWPHNENAKKKCEYFFGSFTVVGDQFIKCILKKSILSSKIMPMGQGCSEFCIWWWQILV